MALLFLIIFMDDETKQMFLHRWRSKRRPLPWVFLNEKGTDRLKRFYSPLPHKRMLPAGIVNVAG
jgi:hypothetical protein